MKVDSPDEILSLADYIDLAQTTLKKQQNITKYKGEHLSRKCKKLLKQKIGNITTITLEEKMEHQNKTLLSFTKLEIPKECCPILSNGLDFKVAAKKLPITNIICNVEETMKNVRSPLPNRHLLVQSPRKKY